VLSPSQGETPFVLKAPVGRLLRKLPKVPTFPLLSPKRAFPLLLILFFLEGPASFLSPFDTFEHRVSIRSSGQDGRPSPPRCFPFVRMLEARGVLQSPVGLFKTPCSPDSRHLSRSGNFPCLKREFRPLAQSGFSGRVSAPPLFPALYP